MSVILYWEVDETGLNFEYVLPDATVAESHAGVMKATSHPVEEGVNVTDHLIIEPEEITIESVLSSTPVEYLATATNEADRAEQLFDKLTALQERGFLATIFTRIKDYENMALLEWSIPRNAAQGHSIFIKLRFKQITIVESSEVVAPQPTVDRAKKKKKLGRKPGNETSAETNNKLTSVSFKVAN